MNTPKTPEQAKYIASHLLTHDATASLALRSLADQVETLQLALETERAAANLYAKQVAHWIEKHDALLAQQLEVAESRDAYAEAADTMAAAHKVELDELSTTLKAIEIKVDTLIIERDALKAERDEFNYSLVSTANRKLRSEVDVLRKERDALKSSELGLNRYAAKVNSDNLKLTAERDALKDAARLALDALLPFGGHGLIMVNQAIAALQEAL